MDADDREWLEQVAEAASRQIARLRELDDPFQKALVADLETLHANIVARLGTTGGDAPGA